MNAAAFLLSLSRNKAVCLPRPLEPPGEPFPAFPIRLFRRRYLLTLPVFDVVLMAACLIEEKFLGTVCLRPPDMSVGPNNLLRKRNMDCSSLRSLPLLRIKNPVIMVCGIYKRYRIFNKSLLFFFAIGREAVADYQHGGGK